MPAYESKRGATNKNGIRVTRNTTLEDVQFIMSEDVVVKLHPSNPNVVA